MLAAAAQDFDRAEYDYARDRIDRIRQLIDEHREREDTVRFESTTSKFIEVARDARVFVDAGAEFGFYSRLALREMQSPQALHLLEPDPPRYRALAEAMSQQATVTVHPTALSDREGLLELYKPASGTSVTLDPAVSEHAELASEHCYRVRSARLDDLLGDSPVDLLKMDIEGAELPAFFGMQRVFAHDRPRIFLEKHRKYIEALDPEGVRKMVRILEQNEYDAYACENGELRRVPGWIPGRAYLCPRELAP